MTLVVSSKEDSISYVNNEGSFLEKRRCQMKLEKGVQNTRPITGYHVPFLYMILSVYCSPSTIRVRIVFGIKTVLCAVRFLTKNTREHRLREYYT